MGAVAGVDAHQERQSVFDLRQLLLAGEAEDPAVLGPDGHDHCAVAFGGQAREIEVGPESLTGAELDAVADEMVDLVLKHVVRQTVGGDAVAQHAARLVARTRRP